MRSQSEQLGKDLSHFRFCFRHEMHACEAFETGSRYSWRASDMINVGVRVARRAGGRDVAA